MAYVDVDKFADAVCKFPAIDEQSANAVISLLRRQPTADVEEVKHGCWKQYGLQNPLCSICHKYNLEQSNYCPNCGAKMDEERKTT